MGTGEQDKEATRKANVSVPMEGMIDQSMYSYVKLE